MFPRSHMSKPTPSKKAGRSVLSQGPITLVTTALHTIRVDARRHLPGQLTMASPVAAVKVDILDVEGMDVARDVTEQRQCDVDKQVGATAGHEEDADGWNCKTHTITD